MRTFVFFSLIFATGQAVVLEDETLRNILNELNTLKTIVAEQQSKIQLLEKKLQSVSEQNRKTEFNFNTDPEVLREKMNPSQTKVPETFKKTNAVSNTHFGGRRNARLLSSSPSTQNVGFTASRQDGSTVHENGIIVFETTITNAGSAYNPTTGIFQAPVSGLYVFFYDIECSKTNGDTYVELVRDGARTGVQAYCHGLGDVDNSATLGVLYLGAGDTVWLRLYDVDNRTFGGKTLFSGFLL